MIPTIPKKRFIFQWFTGKPLRTYVFKTFLVCHVLYERINNFYIKFDTITLSKIKKFFFFFYISVLIRQNL